MKGKILSTILLCTLITTFNFAGGINAKAVSPYDQTTIISIGVNVKKPRN